jgi:hypothetical protein
MAERSAVRICSTLTKFAGMNPKTRAGDQSGRFDNHGTEVLGVLAQERGFFSPPSRNSDTTLLTFENSGSK